MSVKERHAVDAAIADYAGRDLPWVYIGAPDYDHDGRAVGRSCNWLQVKEYVREGDLDDNVRAQLDYETICILAARRGLVPVTKSVLAHGITREEARLIATAWEEGFVTPEGYRVMVPGPRKVEPVGPDEWVRADAVVVSWFPADEYDPLESVRFVRFLPSDTIRKEHLPLIETFLYLSFERPPRYSIEETLAVSLAADILNGIASL